MVSLREDLWALTIRLSPWKDWWFPCKYWKVSTFQALVLSFFWPSLGMCPLCHLKNLKISLTSPQVRISTQQLVRGIPPCFPGRWTSQPKMWSFLPLYFYCWHKYKCPISPTSSKPPPPPLAVTTRCLCLWVMHICSFTSPFSFFYLVPSSLFPSDSCQSVPCVHTSVSIVFLSLFCSIHSTFKWDHMVFVFLWLAYFT